MSMPSVINVYPWQVLGGQVASSIILQEHASCLTLNNTIRNCYSGPFDIYQPNT
jgi:hypothetical protein